IQPIFVAHSWCILHSDCSKTSTYAKMWSLDGSLTGASCMSTAGKTLEQIMKQISPCYQQMDLIFEKKANLVPLHNFESTNLEALYLDEISSLDESSVNVNPSFTPMQ
ncbi:hypothetical protein VP01_11262g1, partial [Puccinia sorghi]